MASRMGNKTIELSHLSKAYGDKKLIEDYSYLFLKNDRIGIIGPNGCGKTTLLKIISGVAKPDQGTIEVGQTIRMGYFSQENEYMDDSMKVIDYVKLPLPMVGSQRPRCWRTFCLTERFNGQGLRNSLVAKSAGYI